MAQSVKHLALDFRSGHDLRVVRLSPGSGSALGVELLESPSTPLPLLSLFHSLSQNKTKQNKNPTQSLIKIAVKWLVTKGTHMLTQAHILTHHQAIQLYLRVIQLFQEALV